MNSTTATAAVASTLTILDFDLLPIVKIDDRYPALPLDQALIILLCVVSYEIVFQILVQGYKMTDKRSFQCVALLHALEATLASSYMFINYIPIFSMERFTDAYVCDRYPMIGKACDCFVCVTFAYFLWDLALTVRADTREFDSVLHLITGLIVVGGATFIPFGQKYMLLVLHEEISTIFLHGYSLCYAIKWPMVADVLRVCFLVTFLYRTVIGWWCFYEVFGAAVFFHIHSMPTPLCLHSIETLLWVLCLPFILLNVLNLWWLGKIVMRTMEVLGFKTIKVHNDKAKTIKAN